MPKTSQLKIPRVAGQHDQALSATRICLISWIPAYAGMTDVNGINE